MEITLIDDEVAEPTESFQLNYDIKVSRNGAETDRVLKLNVSSEIEINDNDGMPLNYNNFAVYILGCFLMFTFVMFINVCRGRNNFKCQ